MTKQMPGPADAVLHLFDTPGRDAIADAMDWNPDPQALFGRIPEDVPEHVGRHAPVVRIGGTVVLGGHDESNSSGGASQSMTELEALIARRRAAHKSAAMAAWKGIHADLLARGIDHTLFGSLAHGNFMAHSDIDLMIAGELDLETRALVRKIVSDHLKGTRIPCDLPFEMDMSKNQVDALLSR